MDKSGPKDNGWSKFEEYAKQRVVGGTSGLPGSRNPLSPTAGRLHKEDMAIYGREPATDKMILVVCELCGRVVKSQALLKHRELYHSNAIRSPPPPRKPADHVPGGMGPIQTIGQSTSLGPTTVGSSKKSKECDLDRHCGVWIESDKRLCRKSITCKIHSLELRQKVRGRSKPFADLLHEYKRQKKIKKMQKRPGGALSSSTLPPPLPPSPAPSSIVPCSPVGSSTSPVLYPPPSLSTGAPTSPLSSSLLVYLDESDSEEYCITSDVSQRQQLLSSSDPPPGPTASVLSEAQLYPKPGAINKFGSRFLSQGCLSFSRRADSLRYSLIALSEQEKEFIHTPDSTILRQCNHLSQQRHVVKKYSQIGRQNHILSSYTRRLNQPSPSTSSSSLSLTTGITTDHTSTNNTPTLDKWNLSSHLPSSNEINASTGHAPIHQITRNRKRSRASSSATVFNSGGTLPTSHNVNTINNIELGHSFDDNGDNDDDMDRIKRPNLSRVKREEDKISSNKLIEQQQYLMKMGYTPPLTMNGIASSPVQPFPVNAGAHSPSTSSGATFVINPSHNILPRSMLPISGFGVPSPSTQSAFSPVVGGERGGTHFPSTTEPHQQLLGVSGGQHQRHQLWVNSQHQQMMNYESNSYHHHPPHSHSPHSLLSHTHSPHHPVPDSLTNNTNEHLIDYQPPSLPHMSKFSLPPNAGVPPSQQQSPGLAHQSVPGSLPPPLNPVGGVGINSASPPRLHRLAPPGGSGGGGGSSQNHHSYHQSGLVASQNVTQRTQQVS